MAMTAKAVVERQRARQSSEPTTWAWNPEEYQLLVEKLEPQGFCVVEITERNELSIYANTRLILVMQKSAVVMGKLVKQIVQLFDTGALSCSGTNMRELGIG